MQNKIKYTLLSAALLMTGMMAGAKTMPGAAASLDRPGTQTEAGAWNIAAKGAALTELERRSPHRAVRSLTQPDGIVDFRPDNLTGISGGASPADIVRKLPVMKIPGGSNLCGFIAYNLLDLDLGIYRIPIKASQTLDLLRSADDMLSSFRGGASSDRYYVMAYYGTTIQNGENLCLNAVFDRNDWSLLAVAGDYGQYERMSSDMTYDPVLDRFYGCFLDRTQSKWVLGYIKIDPAAVSSSLDHMTEVCELEVSLNGLAADKNGTLWGIRNDNGDLVKINKKTGEMTKVASTGFVPAYNGSLAWDNTNGILYWSTTFDDTTVEGGVASAILSVDSETGTLLHVHDYAAAAQTAGLYTEFAAAAAAPGPFTNLKASFAGESLSGTLTFDAPAALADGKAASGLLTYRLSVVKDNGYVAYNKENTCSYGDTDISIPLELRTAGYYTFTLQPYNNAGNGYPLTLTQYVGSDLPMQPGNLAVNYSDGTVTVSWDAVTSTVHGGYHNPEDVTYNVTLSQLDADGNLSTLQPQTVAATSATWQAGSEDSLYGFKATVTPCFGANSGEAAVSPYVWFGSLRPPFLQSMTAEIDGWTPLNVGTGANWVKEYNSRGKGWAIPYNWGTVNNAWLFSPSVMLEKGRYYVMSLKAYSEVVNNEIQVYIGREATPDAMTTKLASSRVAPRSSYSKPVLVTFGFACEETGIYHLGLLNSFRSDTWTNVPFMFINDVTCTPAPEDAPDAPKLTVDYDKTGAVKAGITIEAPTTTYGKTPVDSFDKIVLTANGNEVTSWDNVAAGAKLTYTYEAEKAGNYSFTARASNGDVEGVPAMTTVYLGMSLPVDPEWVDVKEKESVPGTVEVSWAPVAKSANGQDIAPEAITYNLMNIISNTYIERGVTGSPKDVKICDPETQQALYLSVNAETSAGVSSTYGTRMNQSIMHVGKPYDLPVYENFTDGTVHYSWSVVNQHSVYDHISVADAKTELGGDANGDGYCLEAFVPYADSQCSLYSGTIMVPADANSPTLGFACFRQNYGSEEANDKNLNELLVSVIGTEHQGTLAPIVMKDQGLGWRYYYYDLSIFKGEKVNLLFTWHTVGYTTHWLDDIQFFDAPAKDLAIGTLSLPQEVNANARFRIEAAVTNRGTSTLPKGTASLELRRTNDNSLVDTYDLPRLTPFSTTVLQITDRLNNSYGDEVGYKATLVYEGDSKSDNNTAEGSLTLVQLPVPTPTDLNGDRNDDGFASLRWSAPDLSPRFEHYEIGFETSSEASCTELEGFKSVDMDGNEVDSELGISGVCGFTSFPHSRLAHSGSWMAVSPYNVGGKPKDDWLISPELSGAAQTITFYVRTNWDAFEHYTVLTSTTGDKPEDFTTVALDATTKSNDWEKIEIEVPEGTLYFAIHCKAEDTTDLIYLMVDDFKFNGADANAKLTLDGYKTYRDNTLVDQIPVTEAWEDLKGEPGTHIYCVTATYGDDGESAPSNRLFLFTRGSSSVDNVTATPGHIYTEAGRIVIEGADGSKVAVTTLDGITLFRSMNASAKEIIEVAEGIYLVTIDDATVKVQVR